MSADTTLENVRNGSIVTLKQFARQNPAWSEGSLRWLRFNEASNGLAEHGAFIEQGRRVLLDKARFFAWLRAGQKKSA